jgi:glyceraldehyde 3-phosphate dehydrogenase
MAKTRIAINGFGRIGRLFLRQLMNGNDIEVVAVNDLGDKDNLVYLLKYDTVYGRLNKEIKTTEKGFSVGGHEITYLQERDPDLLPWKDLKIDIVVESTGVFESYEKASVHLKAGAKRVVITAPAKDADGPMGKTCLLGVNEEEMKTVKITSNGSCTTNAASPVIAILSENPGIEKAILNTVHAYTATQSIVDGPSHGGDYRRHRAGAQNMSPSTTGAAIAVARAIPGVGGKFDGIATRVPVISGSLADITFIAKRNTSVEEINKILTDAAASPRWKNILKVTSDQVVSSDIIGEPYGAIIDLSFTKVIDGNLVKVLSWYDNEAGYAATLMGHVKKVAENL